MLLTNLYDEQCNKKAIEHWNRHGDMRRPYRESDHGDKGLRHCAKEHGITRRAASKKGLIHNDSPYAKRMAKASKAAKLARNGKDAGAKNAE